MTRSSNKSFKNVDVWSLQFDGVVRKSFEDVKEEINRVESEERDQKIDHILNSAKAKVEGVDFGVGVGGQRTDDTYVVLDDRDGDGDGDNVQDEKVGGKNNNKSDDDSAKSFVSSILEEKNYDGNIVCL